MITAISACVKSRRAFWRPVLHPTSLPEIADLLRRSSGVSVFGSTLVLWDGDRDRRLLTVLEEIAERDLRRLLAVHEHNGGLWMVWRGRVPARYRAGAMVVAYDVPGEHIEYQADGWTVAESVAVRVPRDPFRADDPIGWGALL